MMTSGVQLTTALTDLFSAIITLIPIFVLLKGKDSDRRNRLWLMTFIFFALVCLFGFFLHGFTLSDYIKKWMWAFFFPVSCFMLGYFLLAVRYDIEKSGFGRYYRSVLIMSTLMSIVLMIPAYLNHSNAFTFFAVYSLISMIHVIAMLIKAIRKDRRYCWYLAGIIVFIAGSIFQMCKDIYFVIGSWEFNYDSVYHLFNMVFVFLVFKGIRVLER